MGLFDGLFGGETSSQKATRKYNQRLASEAAVKSGFAGALAFEEAEAAKARLAAAEQGRYALRGILGTPGSYPLPGTPPDPTTGVSQLAPTDPGGIWNTSQPKNQTVTKELIPKGPGDSTYESYFDSARTGLLDPNAAALNAARTPSGQIMSQLTAEAQQLLQKQGPLWDKFSQSVMGPIIEGAAQTYKDSVDIINRETAKGGTARRGAVAEAQRINALEQTNRARASEMWQANLALESYIADRATQQVFNNELYIDAVFRDYYTNAMQGVANFMGGTAVPAIRMSAEQIVSLQQKEIKEKSNWIAKLFGAGISLAGSYLAGSTGTSAFGLTGF